MAAQKQKTRWALRCQRAEERFGLAICYPHLSTHSEWPWWWCRWAWWTKFIEL